MTDSIPPGPAWIPKFLAAMAETGKITHAAKAAGIAPSTAYWQRDTNGQFAEAWRVAANPPQPSGTVADGAREALPPRSGGWRGRFLEALAETSNVVASAIRANVPTRTIYKARREDADFAIRWRAALIEGYDHLEMELLGYLRDPQPKRKMDVAAALRLLAAHRETVERQRALTDDEDEQAVLDSIDAFVEDMRQRRAANTAILAEADRDDGAE